MAMLAWIKRLLALAILSLLIVSAPLWRILAVNPISPQTHAQAAIVLGAATSQNQMSNALKARVDYAIELYQKKRVDQLIFTGGYRDKNPAKDLSEAAVAKAYALSKGIPASAITLDEVSTTTLENIREAKKRMVDLNLKNALVISDEWHLARAVQMAKDEGLQVVGAPTPYSVYQSTSKKIGFVWREVKTTWAYWVAGI
ncbi:multidrug MFS transporter [Formosimonas limnophila]|uniref:Multidrug MFS transporter n=2 Tax=Formosimonas limnophila TaxID=1384487 RepID=A0A8J3CFU6_9BURK|nr:multidrug MFS transporter [Formosimonas limnophila]